MHLAIQNSFPNHAVSAEKEFIARFRRVSKEMGWDVTEVVTSDDILSCSPDAVIVTHDFTPKLTHFPTIGVIWSPAEYSVPDPQRMRNILSYDGCLVATPWLREWIEALFRTHDKQAPISDFDFLPTAIARSEQGLPDEPRLFYAGVHWDGSRHGEIFKQLEDRCPMRIFGKPERWKGLTNAYAGLLPFDGVGVVEAIADCGIALALHTDHHLRSNVPSMRLFEAAAAGAVIVADSMPFAHVNFGDSILRVDTSKAPTEVAAQITAHVHWVVTNRQAAESMALRSKEIFCNQFELRSQLQRLPDFVQEVTESMRCSEAFVASDNPKKDFPLVEVIVRVGSRPVEKIVRSLNSLAAQEYPNIGLIIVIFREVPGLDDLLTAHAGHFCRIRTVNVPDNGMRSGALWGGLRAVRGDYVCNLDDDDTIHPNHIQYLVRALEKCTSDVPLAYTGAIEVQEDDGHWFDQPNFHGDLKTTIHERRRLRFMDDFSIERMAMFDNFVNSNAWLARRSALKPDILNDPCLRVGEDVYLYMMLMRQGPLKFVPTASAEWNWRTDSRDNSMFLEKIFAEDGSKNIAMLQENGALPCVTFQKFDPDVIVNSDARVPTKPSGQNQLSQILRKPSLLLGPYAPALKRLRKKIRNGIRSKSSLTSRKRQELQQIEAEQTRQSRVLHSLTSQVEILNSSISEVLAVLDRFADVEAAQRDATLARQIQEMREADLADLQKRYAELIRESDQILAVHVQGNEDTRLRQAQNETNDVNQT